MLIGEYISQLTDKNRVAIPKKLRIEMKEKVYLTRGYEGCLLMVDQGRWDDLVSEINRKSLLSLTVRDTKRYLLGGATEIVPDNQGRFVIPEALLEFAKLTEEIVFLGVGEWIEIWSKESWREKLENLKSNVADLADRLGEI